MKKIESRPRLYYLDNVKVLLTILVIVHHVGQAYGPTGGYWDFKSAYHLPLLGTFFTINASFFMGLFFFISAYFIPSSLEKHGVKKFVLDRLVRYGIPILFAFFVIVPLDQYYSFVTWRGGPPISFFAYLSKAYFNFGEKPFSMISPSWPELNFGHLWFVQHLLAYSLLYALFYQIGRIFRKSTVKKNPKNSVPGVGTILLYIVIAAYLTGIIRMTYPIDKWVPFLYFIQLEPAHLTSYIFSFVAGIMAYKNRWLDIISQKMAWILFLIGFLMTLFLVYIFATKNQSLGQWFDESRFLYETIMGMTLSFGIVIIAKTLLNRSTPLWKFLSQNAYGAYIFHVPLVILLQSSLEKVPPHHGLLKFLLVSCLSVIASFGVTHLIRMVPGIKKVLG